MRLPASQDSNRDPKRGRWGGEPGSPGHGLVRRHSSAHACGHKRLMRPSPKLVHKVQAPPPMNLDMHPTGLDPLSPTQPRTDQKQDASNQTQPTSAWQVTGVWGSGICPMWPRSWPVFCQLQTPHGRCVGGLHMAISIVCWAHGLLWAQNPSASDPRHTTGRLCTRSWG